MVTISGFRPDTLVLREPSIPRAREGNNLRTLLATRDPDLEVDLQVRRANFWRAHGVPPERCRRLCRRTWKRRAPVTTKVVCKSVRRVPLHSLEGVVYGPDGTPLADALVQLPSLSRSTRTGRHGEFNFETVPAFGVRELLVAARDKEMVIDVAKVSWPLAIHFQVEE